MQQLITDILATHGMHDNSVTRGLCEAVFKAAQAEARAENEMIITAAEVVASQRNDALTEVMIITVLANVEVDVVTINPAEIDALHRKYGLKKTMLGNYVQYKLVEREN